MNLEKKNLRLYAVTDRSWLRGETLYSQVEKALKGGASMIQLREKELDEENFLSEARQIGQLCRNYHVPLVINDKVDIALQADADGVHVGQKDMGVLEARRRLGPDKILGVSARTVEQAVLAEQQGADYLGVGAVFTTSTKLDARGIQRETLRDICQAVSIPVVAIGGITRDNLMELKGSGIAGIAVVSAVFAQKDIEASSRELSEKVEILLEEGQ